MDIDKDEIFNNVLHIFAQLHPFTTLTWGDLGAREVGEVIEADWVDVYLPEICDELEINWLWTIENQNEVGEPIAIDNDNKYSILLPHDKALYSVSNDGVLYDTDKVIIKDISEDLTLEEQSQLEDARINPDSFIIRKTGWSKALLQEAMSEWCRFYVGRVDLIFTFDQNAISPQYRDFSELSIEDAKEVGKVEESQELYLIDEGIKITSLAFDALLEMDIDRAAEVVKVMKDMRDNSKDTESIEIDLFEDPFDERE